MAWKDIEPLVEKNNCCPGLENDPWFRIIEDDGCYIVLLHDGQVPKDHEDSWVVANWIFPEAFDELVKLPRPRGGIYELGRDGPMAPDDGAFEALVAQRHMDNEEDRAKIVERQERKPS